MKNGQVLHNQVGEQDFTGEVHDIKDVPTNGNGNNKKQKMMEQLRDLRSNQAVFVKRPKGMGVSKFRQTVRGAAPEGFHTQQDEKLDGMWVTHGLASTAVEIYDG